MVRTARSIHGAVQPLLQPGDTVTCRGDGMESTRATHQLRGFGIKLRKRLLHPAKLWLPGYDILHLVDNDYAIGVPPWRWRATVITVHDLMPFLIADRLEEVFNGRMGLWFYRHGLANLARAGRVVCVSSFTRACLLERIPLDEARVRIVPQGIDAAFRPCAPDDARLEAFRRAHGLQGRRVILHVGSCAPYKQIDALLSIVARLRASGIEDLCLLKVGGVFNEEQHRLIAAHGLADHLVHLHGLDESNLVRAYNAAALLLWPSTFEGFGLPILEAMACGTPVVCSSGGALDETAGDAASKHPADDWDGMIAACRRVLQDPVFADRLRTRGKAHAAAFSWNETAGQYYRIYKELLEESAHASD